MSLGISCHRLQDIKELEKSAFQLVFSSAERIMEKDFKNMLKDSSSTLHNNVCIIVVDESHTVETWTGKRFVFVFVFLPSIPHLPGNYDW